MQKYEKRFAAIMRKYEDFSKLPSVRNLPIVTKMCGKVSLVKRQSWITIVCIVVSVLAAKFIYFYYTSQCLSSSVLDASKLFRPPEDCSMCRDVTHVAKVKNISPADFDARFASVSAPVVVTDGTGNWSAKEKFSFDFFKRLYESTVGDDPNSYPDCQFFPYKTEFKSLREVLNMSAARSRLETGTEPWYIGWSNCDDKAGKVIRQHYERPYFLPNTSENMALSWIFMGGPGNGAHMHVDNVQYPSWQAQLSGKKRWRLMPPPECYYSCNEIVVTVQKGEIIVVDTNRWYHQTFILPGEISITIGSEFD